MDKYTVNYNGKTMKLTDFCAATGLEYNTLRNRARRGAPILQQRRTAAPLYERHMPDFHMEDGMRVGVYRDGYTFSELTELYRGFAGQPDELRMVMDFTGLTRRPAEKLLEKLRESAEKNRRVFA